MARQRVMGTQTGPIVAVFGATGHTGRFVVAELRRRGFVPLEITRRTASVDDPASLDRALAGAAAVINCAGPFLDTAEAVAAAAVRARIHYLDVTAEQASAQATFERFDGPARDAGITVIPAMAFYGGFGDLLATAAMGDWASADEIRIGIALDSWQPTEGTRATGRRNTAQRVVINGGRLAPLPAEAPAPSPWEFPEPFGRQAMVEVPLSETIAIARHLRVSEMHNYLNEKPLQELLDVATPPPQAVDGSGRSAQRFAVEAVVRKGTETWSALASGRDIYAFTAPLVVEAAQRILAGAGRPGAFAPGELFDARDFLRALAPEFLDCRVGGCLVGR